MSPDSGLDIGEEPLTALADYATIPIAFVVARNSTFSLMVKAQSVRCVMQAASCPPINWRPSGSPWTPAILDSIALVSAPARGATTGKFASRA